MDSVSLINGTSMAHKLIDNQNDKQYEFHIDGFVPRIEYIKAKEQIYLTHTEVPAELEGKGIGFALIHAALQDIDENDWTLIPLCPFVATYIKRHPEWRRLVLKGIHV